MATQQLQRRQHAHVQTQQEHMWLAMMVGKL
jgi:hypothetical protein